MVDTDPEAVPLAAGIVVTVVVIDERASVIQICCPGTLLLNISAGPSIHVIGVELHIVIKQVECAVDTGHPGCSDAVVSPIYNYETCQTEFEIYQSPKKRDEARGSKYMQSYPLNTFREAEKWLRKNDGDLLFVGVG